MGAVVVWVLSAAVKRDSELVLAPTGNLCSKLLLVVVYYLILLFVTVA